MNRFGKKKVSESPVAQNSRNNNSTGSVGPIKANTNMPPAYPKVNNSQNAMSANIAGPGAYVISTEIDIPNLNKKKALLET